MENFGQTSIIMLQIQELIDKLNHPKPWVISTHFECQTCGDYWVVAGMNETFADDEDHPGVWHEEQGHEITSRDVMAPQHVVDIAQLDYAKQLMELTRDFLQEAVHDLRAVIDTKQRVIAEQTKGQAPLHLELVDRHVRDTSTARYGWDVIGAALGVSAQAAQSRFSR